ncbi:unnamed protein product [Thlaspi arvense]|uniref:ARID domain-containing protein n=1 Tax=Thlaspi arvense TaxID=13288 RepID=A0AAU9S731_THLAR|nr:unnamed protein product [Thlaspi arvense]
MSPRSMNKTRRVSPSPLSSYEEVVADKDLFMSTLKTLHSEMGTKFWIPKVRFEDLDLHKLFVEVTSRGGIEQTVREEKWKDVFDTFSFPKSQQNPIFTKILRGHYYSLLRDYEIAYLFKSRCQFPPLGSGKLEGVLHESTETSVTQDPERQSYDVFPNIFTDKANSQGLFNTKGTAQWKRFKKHHENEVVLDAVTLQQCTPKQNTEAGSPMEESEEKDEVHYSDSEMVQGSSQDEIAIHREEVGDLTDTSEVADEQS